MHSATRRSGRPPAGVSMKRVSDFAALVESAERGDLDAHRTLLVHYLPTLQAFVCQRAAPEIRAKEECVDVVQSICCDVLAHLPRHQYRGGASFRRWLLEHAEHRLRNLNRYYRAQRRDGKREVEFQNSFSPEIVVRGHVEGHEPSEEAILHEELGALERAFGQLPRHYRDVINLAYVVGLSHARIGGRFRMTESGSRSLLHRALARLGKASRPRARTCSVRG